MPRLLIHNFYGKSSPSGEDNFVRTRRARYSHVAFSYSELLYVVKWNFLCLFIIASVRFHSRLKKLVDNNAFSKVEVHNVNPIIGIRAIAGLSKLRPTTVYLHNFRLIAPCGVLMDRNGNHCTLCVARRRYLWLTPFWKCYRNSSLFTLFLLKDIFYFRFLNALKNVRNVVTFSSYHVEVFKKYFGQSTDFTVMKNLDANLLSKYDPAKNPNRSFVYLGRLTKEKGILELVKIWPKDKSFRLDIFGDGSLRDELCTSIRGRENIHYHGLIKSEDVDRQFKSRLAVIIPSRCSEGFPTVIGEAVRNNMYVLTSDISPQREHTLAIGGSTFLLDDPASLEKTLNSVLN